MAVDQSAATPPIALLRDRFGEGAMRVSQLGESLAARLSAPGDERDLFAWCDPDHLRRQAAALDGWRARGRALGDLHGVPLVLDDTIDAAFVPTGNGLSPDQARRPERDSAIAEGLRRAGLMIVGKSRCAELRYGAGEATLGAIVARGLAQAGIGVEADGHVIRQAAHSGLVGYRPSFGSVARRGSLALSPSLDSPAVLAQSVAEAALVADAIVGADPDDRSTVVAPHPALHRQAAGEPLVKPLFGFVRTGDWGEADAAVQAGLQELVAHLGSRCFEAELPPIFAECDIHYDRVLGPEASRSLAGFRERSGEAFSATLHERLDAGDSVLARDYLASKDWQGVYRAGIHAILDRCDAILTPATAGPSACDNAGRTFRRIWQFAGLPVVTLPLLEDEAGRPVGVLLVGRHGEDGRLLRTARWLEQLIQTGDTP
ncbi:MAG: amidase family protein [Pseudomonadota bacterium]|nr:amidase family protein [Pseudomonadota bacterium]